MIKVLSVSLILLIALIQEHPEVFILGILLLWCIKVLVKDE